MHEIRSSILSGEVKSGPVARKGGKKAAPSLGGLGKIAIKREEPRCTNQRSEDRHPNVVAQSTIVFRRRKQQVRVVNVSSRGAMIEAEIEPRIGEPLDIVFSDENRTRCAVRWVREGRIGLEFVNETIFWETAPGGTILHAQPAAEREDSEEEEPAFVDREPRQRLIRSGMLYWSGITVPVRMRNISSGGARVEGERQLCPGAEVELDLGDGGFHIAEVRWSKDGQIGLRFAADFDLDSLVPAASHAGPLPEVLKPAYLETELRADSPWAARFERLSTTDLKLLDREG